jgi:hypothetical protein
VAQLGEIIAISPSHLTNLYDDYLPQRLQRETEFTEQCDSVHTLRSHLELTEWCTPRSPYSGPNRGAAMAAIAKALSRTLGYDIDVETLKTIAMFCAGGLFVSLLFASFGLDLGAGFF